MRTKKRKVIFKEDLFDKLENIRDDCRRNQQPDIYQTSYKPLLLQSSQNFRKKNFTMRSLDSKQRNKILSRNDFTPERQFNKTFTPKSQSFNKFRQSQQFTSNEKNRKILSKQTQYSSIVYSQDKNNLKIDALSFFLRKLYFAKTKDLDIQPHPKQQRIFMTRLQQTINQHNFMAPECDFGLCSIKSITKYLHQNPIQKLNLDKNPIGDEGSNLLSQLIPSLKLTELSLMSINITSKGGYALIKSIVGHPNMEVLNLSSLEGLNRNRINFDGYRQVKQIFEHPLCKLNHLNLSNTGMGPLGFVYFCSGFSKQNSIHFKVLNLAQNQISISEEDAPFIKSSFSNISVQRLQLQNNNISDLGAKIIAYIIGALYGRSRISQYLTYIDLSKNNIISNGFEQLCNSLYYNKKLVQVNINQNNLSIHQVFFSVKFLLNSTWSLKKLSLRNSLYTTKSSEQHYKSLAQGLYKNKSLRELDLSYNPIDPKSFTLIFDNLQENKTLKSLYMEGCDIGDVHLAQAQNFMKLNKSIIQINFCNNFINDKGAKTLIKILSQAHNISQINIKRNCISLHLLNQIAYQLKQNKALAQNHEDPELVYISYISNLQQVQRKNIQSAIMEISDKSERIVRRDLAVDVVIKQDQVSRKEHQIRVETIKISKLEAEINNINKQASKKKHSFVKKQVQNQSTFLVTS